jgi:pyruvate-ferredoxin/flavodoxin oxidoreductase
MATFGGVNQGKQEMRKEMGLIGFAHRTSYILQSSSASPPHLIEGFIEGLNSRRPALFNIYTACQPEHGIADDISYDQSKLALESRAYPFVRYNPDKGNLPSECFDLDGNPEIELDWPKYPLHYLDDDGNECSMELAMTFADFAASEARFRKHFKEAPRDTWDDESMMPIADYLDLAEEDREDIYPFVWTINDKQQLRRTLMTQEIVDSTIERLNNWRLLKGLAGLDIEELDEASIADNVRVDMISRITGSLVKMATSNADEDATSASSSETKAVPQLDVGS